MVHWLICWVRGLGGMVVAWFGLAIDGFVD